MPELPEVETVRTTLQNLLPGKKIIGTRIFLNKIIKEPAFKTFQKQIVNQKFNYVNRKGKYLYFELDDFVLISHLRMEGKYYYQKKSEKAPWKHVLIVFELDNKYELRYHDTRRFGTFNLQSKKNYKTRDPYLKTGPEPFSDSVTVAYLKKSWENKRIAVKSILLDQKYMSGIGNIYADEILYASKINPFKQGKLLTDEELQKIINNSRIILRKAIKYGGTTVATYTSSLGIDGKFQNKLRVHTKKNIPCSECQTIIVKDKINQRGTYYCPLCQKVN